jgi:hypothetical protein
MKNFSIKYKSNVVNKQFSLQVSQATRSKAMDKVTANRATSKYVFFKSIKNFDN